MVLLEGWVILFLQNRKIELFLKVWLVLDSSFLISYWMEVMEYELFAMNLNVDIRVLEVSVDLQLRFGVYFDDDP